MNGIDVSAADGVVDWAAAYAEGVGFAFVRASAGMGTDARFRKNVFGAHSAGIAVGVYHDLVSDGTAEAAHFLSVISPLRDKISLWSACRAEDAHVDVRTFLDAVSKAGFSPMLAAPPQVIERLPDASKYPLWLLLWGASESRALSFCPTLWQYGAGQIANLARVHMNRGY